MLEFSETGLRLGFFLGLLALFMIAESVLPRRRLRQPRPRRWGSNLGLVVLNTVVVRFIFPAGAIGVALLAEQRAWGLLALLPALPSWVTVVAAVILLDAAIYLQHIMFHAVPAFWRLHRVHHADLDFDVTTGIRFHPIEIVLSMVIKFGVIVALGAPPLAVLIFEIALNATSMFNHSNLRLPLGVDRVLRWFVVTPDMHRVHHSVHDHETNSNFGFNLPWWDRLLGTYRAQPADGHVGMRIGITTFRDRAHCVALSGLLLLPFTGKADDYPINRRSWKRRR
jgi:sterol desaturase/sphingolipid hydroxylase (fatty acid hydroxylase superfamily)